MAENIPSSRDMGSVERQAGAAGSRDCTMAGVSSGDAREALSSRGPERSGTPDGHASCGSQVHSDKENKNVGKDQAPRLQPDRQPFGSLTEGLTSRKPSAAAPSNNSGKLEEQARKRRRVEPSSSPTPGAESCKEPEEQPAAAEAKVIGAKEKKGLESHLMINPDAVLGKSKNSLVLEGQLDDGQRVAVKFFGAKDPDGAKATNQGLMTATQSGAKGIVQSLGVWTDALGDTAVVMEQCTMSLEQLLQGEAANEAWKLTHSDGSLTDFGKGVLRSLAETIEELHASGVGCLGISTEHVLLNPGGEVKIIDLRHCVATDSKEVKAKDIQDFGVVMWRVLTGGRFPTYSACREDQGLFSQKGVNLSLVAWDRGALEMLEAILQNEASLRPRMAANLIHPWWLSAHQTLAFLVALSNVIEDQIDGPGSTDRELLRILERDFRQAAVGNQPWKDRLGPAVMALLETKRGYSSFLRDLLRLVRNTIQHPRLNFARSSLFGSTAEDHLRFFTSPFPGLVYAAFCFAKQYCSAAVPLAEFIGNGVGPEEYVFGLLAPASAIKAQIVAGNGQGQTLQMTGTPPAPTAAQAQAGGLESCWVSPQQRAVIQRMQAGHLPSPQELSVFHPDLGYSSPANFGQGFGQGSNGCSYGYGPQYGHQQGSHFHQGSPAYSPGYGLQQAPSYTQQPGQLQGTWGHPQQYSPTGGPIPPTYHGQY